MTRVTPPAWPPIRLLATLPVAVLVSLQGCKSDSASTEPGNDPPSVTVLSPPPGTTVVEGTPVGLSGTATDDTDGNLSSSIRWTSSRDGALGVGASVTATLSAGTHDIQASVTDSDGQQATASRAVIVEPDPPPSVTITGPADGTTVAEAAVVRLTATATDVPDGDLTAAVEWSSDLDGTVGTGGSVDAALSAGTHRITASVVDSRGQAAEDEITVTVEADAPPEVTITEPADGTTVFEGTVITFSGSASDHEDGDLSASIRWTSDRDGGLGQGVDLRGRLTLGTHRITASVTDSQGRSAQDAITVTVEAGGGEPAGQFEVAVSGAVSGTFEGQAVHSSSGITLLAEPPLGRIRLHRREVPDAPGTYPVRHVFDVVSGEADPESFWGTVTGTEHRLVSEGSVVVTAASWNHAEGTLELQASDESGQSPITVEGSFEAYGAAETGVPRFTPFTTAPGVLNAQELQDLLALYSPRIPVAGSFRATVWLYVDTEGTVVNTLLNESSGWRSADLAALAVADGARFTPARNRDEVVPVWISLPFTFEVTEGLAVSVTAPATNSSFVVGTAVTFAGTATDPQDGDLSASIVWSSDADGQLGTGASVQSTLSTGSHTITATVTDSDGNTATDSIFVVISRRQ